MTTLVYDIIIIASGIEVDFHINHSIVASGYFSYFISSMSDALIALVTIYSFNYLFTQHIFIGSILYARYYEKGWGKEFISDGRSNM